MKKWFGNLDMTKKLLVSPLAAMCFFAVFALVSYGTFFKQKAVLDDIVQHRFGNYTTSADMIMDLKGVHANIYKLMNWTGSGSTKGRSSLLRMPSSPRSRRSKMRSRRWRHGPARPEG